MCHVKNLSAYETSDELLMDINKCNCCPSLGSLIKDPGECAIFQGMLKRYTALIQKEYLPKFQKEKEFKEKEEETPFIAEKVEKYQSGHVEEVEEVSCEG